MRTCSLLGSSPPFSLHSLLPSSPLTGPVTFNIPFLPDQAQRDLIWLNAVRQSLLAPQHWGLEPYSTSELGFAHQKAMLKFGAGDFPLTACWKQTVIPKAICLFLRQPLCFSERWKRGLTSSECLQMANGNWYEVFIIWCRWTRRAFTILRHGLWLSSL